MKAKSFLFVLAALVAMVALFLLMGQGDPPSGTTEEIPVSAPGEKHADEAPAIAPVAPPSSTAPVRETPRSAAPVPPAQASIGAGIVKGRLVETSGEPVPGFLVEAYGGDLRLALPSSELWFEEKSFAPDWKAATTQTDEEGRFELRDLPSRAMYVLGLNVGRNRPQFRFLDAVPSPGETVDLGDIPLDPYVIFTGRILDEKSQPISGARIRATVLPTIVVAAGMGEVRPDGALLMLTQGGMGFRRQGKRGEAQQIFTAPPWLRQLLEKFPVPTTHSDAEGRFRLEGVPLGSATVVVDAEERPLLQHGPVPTGNSGTKDLGDLRMDEGETLEGRVVDSQGQGIAGAEVFAGARSSMAPVAILRRIGTTDADGKFAAKGMKDSASYAIARVDASSPWGISEELSPGSDKAQITIDTGLDLVVRVKGSDGNAAASAEILVKSMLGSDELPIFFPPVNLRGRLEREPDGAFRVKSLNPGEYTVIARAPGYALAIQKVSIEKDSPTIEMALKPATPAKIVVLDKQNETPIANARVAARQADAKFWAIPLATAKTDAQGQAVLPGLASGSYLFEASHPLYGTETTVASIPRESIGLSLDGAATVEGRVHEGGRVPDQPRMIAFEPRGEREFFTIPRIVSTDLEGKYRVTHLEPGEYRINVQQRLVQQGTMDLFKMMEGGPQKRSKVIAVAGKTVQHDIDLSGDAIEGPSGKLQGHVTVNGRPAANVTISTWNDGRLVAKTDPGGYFEMTVPAGDSWVSVSMPASEGKIESQRLGSRNISVKEGETVEASWDFATGILRGKVVKDKDGSPAAFLAVSGNIRTGEGKTAQNSWLNTTTDKYGEFTFDPAPAGEWNLSVQSSGFARPNVSTKLSEGEMKTGIEIRLQEAVEVAGRIAIPPQGKLQWMWVSFRQEKNARQGGASVDTEKLTFVCDNIGPGKYFVDLHTWNEGKSSQAWETLTVEIPQHGADDLVLEFKPKAPQEKKN